MYKSSPRPLAWVVYIESSIAKGKLIVHNQKIETKVQEVAFSQVGTVIA